MGYDRQYSHGLYIGIYGIIDMVMYRRTVHQKGTGVASSLGYCSGLALLQRCMGRGQCRAGAGAKVQVSGAAGSGQLQQS